MAQARDMTVVFNETRETVVCDKCLIADTFFKRIKGFIGRTSLDAGEGILLVPCRSVHMFFMRMPLDVIFISSDNYIVYLFEGLKPWHISPTVWRAKSVLEVPKGTINQTGTQTGDLLKITQTQYI